CSAWRRGAPCGWPPNVLRARLWRRLSRWPSGARERRWYRGRLLRRLFGGRPSAGSGAGGRTSPRRRWFWTPPRAALPLTPTLPLLRRTRPGCGRMRLFQPARPDFARPGLAPLPSETCRQTFQHLLLPSSTPCRSGLASLFLQPFRARTLPPPGRLAPAGPGAGGKPGTLPLTRRWRGTDVPTTDVEVLMKALNLITLILTIIGGINWGLIGL